MKKLMILLVLVVMVFSLAVTVLAAGMPAAHGVDGRTFGGLVSQEDPKTLADHVSGNVGGITSAHGLSGAGFGAAVAGADPCFIAGHVSGR